MFASDCLQCLEDLRYIDNVTLTRNVHRLSQGYQFNAHFFQITRGEHACFLEACYLIVILKLAAERSGIKGSITMPGDQRMIKA